MSVEGMYNPGFGDFNEITGSIDDKVVSNNNDSKKVLATVAATVYTFTDENPDALVFATGSNVVRTRLYRIGITNNFFEIEKDFFIYGLRKDVWVKFSIGINYDAFIVKRKFSKFDYEN